MPCSTQFYNQCNVWQVYAVTSVTTFIAVAAVCYYAGLSNWSTFVDVSIALGCVTCLVWWMWVMKKLRDIAIWWTELHSTIDQTGQTLAETKQDIKELKTVL